jgi:SAM-dependent methyltransferase
MPIFSFRTKAHRRKKRGAWQQLSLVAGLLAGRHFVGAKDLHYGYWQDIEPLIRNLPQAQEAYSQFLLAHIPADAHRILDVGSGAGGLAAKLLARGHEVDCVCPSAFLNEQTRALCGERTRIFECKYEDFKTSDIYDAIVFCESFQYINMEIGLELAVSQLRKGGSMVICDFFHTGDQKGSISGGHNYYEFKDIIPRFPLQLVEDIDITQYTAPTFTVIDAASTEVVQPIWVEFNRALMATRPRTARLVRWWFRHKIAKFENKYFTHQRSAENFQRSKTYRLLRYERQ